MKARLEPSIAANRTHRRQFGSEGAAEPARMTPSSHGDRAMVAIHERS
jgi:hypothetical protein